MWTSQVLSVLGVVAVAHGFPQGSEPYTNSTKPSPTSTEICEAKCAMQYPRLSAISWVPKSLVEYTTEIKAGTVGHITFTKDGTPIGSRTVTVYSETMPPGHDLYQQYMNEGETRSVIARFSRWGEEMWTEVVYPTPFVSYRTEYQWEGILPTRTNIDNPTSVCSTAAADKPAKVPLTYYVDYPTPTTFAAADVNDPSGEDYEPVWIEYDAQPDEAFFDLYFAGESAFALCSSVVLPSPTPTKFSAPKFIFDTTTVFRETQSGRIIHWESSASTWEDPSDEWNTVMIPHFESSADDWGHITTTKRPQVMTPRPTATEPKDPHAQVTQRPEPPYNENDPDPEDDHLGPVDPPAFTSIETVIDGTTTSIPAFVISGRSTASLGQTVKLDDVVTTASAGQTVTLDGVVTTASSGQTFTSNGAVVTATADGQTVTMDDVVTTATEGQTVTLDDIETVLSSPTASKSRAPEFEGMASRVGGASLAGIVALVMAIVLL